jgi:hypothetical protein
MPVDCRLILLNQVSVPSPLEDAMSDDRLPHVTATARQERNVIQIDIVINSQRDPIDSLTKSERYAYLANCLAEQVTQQSPLNQDAAYGILNEQGLPDEFGDYELPECETWKKHLRSALRKLGEGRNSPRHGRALGRSIVRRDQI